MKKLLIALTVSSSLLSFASLQTDKANLFSAKGKTPAQAYKNLGEKCDSFLNSHGATDRNLDIISMNKKTRYISIALCVASKF